MSLSAPFVSQVNLDMAKLFPAGNLLGQTGTPISLLPLKSLTTRPESFLPAKVYIRAERQLLLKELTELPYMTKIVTGSPGIGKSITFFLAALFRAWKADHTTVLYFRCTKDPKENASIFVMQKMENNTVNVKFNRSIWKDGTAYDIFYKLVKQINGWQDMTIMVDGPEPVQAQFFSPLDSFCTSGVGLKITSELNAGTHDEEWDNPDEEWGLNKKPRLMGATNVVMSAWKKEDMRKAIMSCGNIAEDHFSEDLFDEIYFVTGGRIREAVTFYRAGVPDTSFVDGVVSRVSRSAARLALARADERSTSEHVDSMRSIFRRNESFGRSDDVDILVDSQLMIRKLHKIIDVQELLNSYHIAEKNGHRLAASEYFEELMHWFFCQPRQFSPTISCFIRSQGKGAEGVGELKKSNCYWIPSVPNFVNIDAAIVNSDGHMWCFQYTTGKTHTFKKRRLRHQFLDIVNKTLSIQDTTVIFVVPIGNTFTAPDTSGECNARVAYVDCKTMETVKDGLVNILALLS